MKVTDRDREAADAWLDMYYASAGNFMCEPLYEAFAEARAEGYGEGRREALEEAAKMACGRCIPSIRALADLKEDR